MPKSKFQQSLQKSLEKESSKPKEPTTLPGSKSNKASDKVPLAATISSSSPNVEEKTLLRDDGADRAMQLEGDVDVKDLVPFLGTCCVIASCFPVYPDCLGAVSESTLLCISSRVLLCKPSKGYTDDYCKLCLLDFDCVPVKVCCRSRTQFFCLDLRTAIPPNADDPCLVSFCFWTCAYQKYMNCNCFSTVRNIEDKHRENLANK